MSLKFRRIDSSDRKPIAAPVEVTLFQPDEFYRVERGDSIGPLGCAATRAAGRSLQCRGS
jgi:hypothetical protein